MTPYAAVYNSIVFDLRMIKISLQTILIISNGFSLISETELIFVNFKENYNEFFFKILKNLFG